MNPYVLNTNESKITQLSKFRTEFDFLAFVSNNKHLMQAPLKNFSSSKKRTSYKYRSDGHYHMKKRQRSLRPSHGPIRTLCVSQVLRELNEINSSEKKGGFHAMRRTHSLMLGN